MNEIKKKSHKEKVLGSANLLGKTLEEILNLLTVTENDDDSDDSDDDFGGGDFGGGGSSSDW